MSISIYELIADVCLLGKINGKSCIIDIIEWVKNDFR